MEKHVIREENAVVILDWLRNRGGIAVWASVDLCDLGKSWTAPVNDEHGQPKGKPSWQADSKPCRIITDPADVIVSQDKEVKRFHVAVRMGASGTRMKLTDGSTRKLRAAVAKAGAGAYY